MTPCGPRNRSDGEANRADEARRTGSGIPCAVSPVLIVLTVGKEAKDVVPDEGDVPTAPGRVETPAATAAP